MPFPNYHVARVRDPKDFKPESIRTIHGGTHVFAGSGMIVVPENIHVITGQLLDQFYEGKKIERAPQSLRFPKSDFTVDQVKMWLKDERVKIIMFEPASETVEKVEEEASMNWYNYKIEEHTHEVEIMGDIGEGGSSAESLKSDIIANNPENLTLNISSLGGNVNDALQVYDFLRSFNGRVTAKISGMTASAATIIAMGADEIHMSPYSLILIHQVWSPYVSGSADDLERSAQDMRKIDNILVDIYAKKTKKRRDSIAKLMHEERWLGIDEALALGLVDKKISNTKNIIDLKIMNKLKERGLPSIPNILLNKIKHSNMEMKDLITKIEILGSKIESYFSKDSEPTEESITLTEEVRDIQNIVDGEILRLTTALDAKNKDIETLKNDHQEENKKLSDEVDRLSAEESKVITTDEAELEKSTEPVSPFDEYAKQLKF